MRLFVVLLLASSPAAAMDAAREGVGDTAAYRIVDYKADASGAVGCMTRRTGLFGEVYTRYRTVCDGSFVTLFLGSGESYEEAARNSAIKGNAALLIGGTGDEAPPQACALIGTSHPKGNSSSR